MIIDAMELLYTGPFSGFCLVSSDSDFTRLAARIRESGRHVYGFGERKTPRPFVSACDRFIYTEIFSEPKEDAYVKILIRWPQKKLRCDTKLLNLFRSAVNAASDETGWAPLAQIGSYASKTNNDFDPRNYGFEKLSELIAAIGLFEIDRRGNLVFVRNKK